MASDKLIDNLRKEAKQISRQLARSTIGFKEKGYLQGRLDQINKTLAELAKSNNGDG